MKLRVILLALLANLAAACGGGDAIDRNSISGIVEGTETPSKTIPQERARWVAFVNQDRQVRMASLDGKTSVTVSSTAIDAWYSVYEYALSTDMTTVIDYQRVGNIYSDNGVFREIDLVSEEPAAPVRLPDDTTSQDVCRSVREGDFLISRITRMGDTCLENEVRSYRTGKIRLLYTGRDGLVAYDENMANPVVLDSSAKEFSKIHGVSTWNLLKIDNVLRFYDVDENSLGPVIHVLSNNTPPSFTHLDEEGLIYYTHDGNLYRVDPTSGAPAVFVGSLSAGNNTFTGILKKQAVFQSSLPGGANRIYIMDTHTGQINQLVDTQDPITVCTFDDTRIYYMRVGRFGDAHIYRVDTNGNTQYITSGLCVGQNKALPIKLADLNKSRFLLAADFARNSEGKRLVNALRIVALGDTPAIAEYKILDFGFQSVRTWDAVGFTDRFVVLGQYPLGSGATDLVSIAYSRPGEVVRITQTRMEGEYDY